MSAPISRSGLQNEVINFYRKCCRAIRKKPIESRYRFQQFVRSQFRQYDISPRDHNAIEYMLRRGQRQLEAYESDSVKDVNL
ncbi:12501_t:CDS:2 [Funneliformis caledonium]|uniref:12501_t:CDS:1 n=1 Tax=Funneliformis caledonium TaxID=1117310 RepID=A0A9N9IZL2_9GLOM|nr:12501_t:CDS:2 [Funneliformis caledonium]